MGMMNRSQPPAAPMTGPMQGRQAFGWTPVGQMPAQQPFNGFGLLSGIFGGGIGSRFGQGQQFPQTFTGPMQGRQAFGWTPIGQGQVFGGVSAPPPSRTSSGGNDLAAKVRRAAKAIQDGTYTPPERRTGDTRSDELTHTGAKPRDRYNPFGNEPTRPEANPRRSK